MKIGDEVILKKSQFALDDTGTLFPAGTSGIIEVLDSDIGKALLRFPDFSNKITMVFLKDIQETGQQFMQFAGQK